MEKQIFKILNYSILAPSGHNTQPWAVKVNNNTVEVYLDDSKKLPNVDPDNREAFFSITAFVRAFEVAAEGYGLKTETIYKAKNPIRENQPLFQIKILENGITPKKQKHDLLCKRFTDRTPFNKEKVDKERINSFLSLDKEHILYFPADSAEADIIKEMHIVAFKKQSFNNKKQKELAQWLRFKKPSKKGRGEGIYPAMLGLGAIPRMFWYAFYNEKTAMSNTFIKQGIKNACKQVENTAGFIMITSKSNNTNDLAIAGKTYMNFLLECTAQGIKNHTISQILEENPFKENIMGSVNVHNPVQFIIRIGTNNNKGYGKHFRRNVGSILIKE